MLYNKQYDFENITESEALEFVTNNNIDIPLGIVDSKVGEITKSIIQKCASNSNAVFFYNYGEMQKYADEIKEIVPSKNNNSRLIENTNTYYLQDNTVKNENGYWVTSGGAYDDRWENYNCYAYAINRIEQPQFYLSGAYSQYQPGNMSSGTFNANNDISFLANIVKNDLLAIGCTNVILYTSFPTLPSGNEELICVRQGTSDYHFMHYDKTENAWLHKPGGSAVLKYNYTPNNDLLWFIEYSSYGVENIDYSEVYASDIYFIKYTKPSVNINSGNNLTTSLYIQSGKDSVLEVINSTNSNINISLSAGTAISVNLYDDEMDWLNTYSGSNIAFATTGSYKKYYVRVNFSSSTNYGNVSITINHHSHTYSYTSISSTQHRVSCGCGYTSVANHVWTQSSGGIILNVDPNLPNALVKYVCTACGYETNKPPIGA